MAIIEATVSDSGLISVWVRDYFITHPRHIQEVIKKRFCLKSVKFDGWFMASTGAINFKYVVPRKK